MRLVNAAWSPQINWLMIWCDCFYFFWHRSDRWQVNCPRCRKNEHLAIIRERYVDERHPT